MYTQPSLIGIVVQRVACIATCQVAESAFEAGIVFQQGKFGDPLLGCDMDRLTIVHYLLLPFRLDATQMGLFLSRIRASASPFFHAN
jgi:hypothetical protein